MSWFDDFKSNDGGEPPDGLHTARLDDTALLDTRNGPKIKLTWQTPDLAYWWESWHGVDGRARVFTKEILRGLEIDLAALGSADDLAVALEGKQGVLFEVGVERNGDWLNTSVEGRAVDPEPDLPIDTDDFADAVPVSAGAADDDDVPF